MNLIDSKFWRGKRVLVTGHTGFKGAWITSWLASMKSDILGYSLPSEYTEDAYSLLQVSTSLSENFSDVRNANLLGEAIASFQPEIIFHLAAQPLVQQSYEDPIKTFETNILGTANLLKASANCSCVSAIVVITSDKCYQNQEQNSGYTEDQALGGHDPYSSSKACAEIITSSWYQSYIAKDGRCGIATARAGNVIGGGDCAPNRLIPDILRATKTNQNLTIRNADAIRPWQYVLDPLSGYLLLAQALSQNPGEYSGAWNFGPTESEAKSVSWISDQLTERMGRKLELQSLPMPAFHETNRLLLDSTKARKHLNWRPRYSTEAALDGIVYWEHHRQDSKSLKEFAKAEFKKYYKESTGHKE